MSHVGAGRYAPSPTGELHLGNLRTAVLAWLFARSTGRRFLLRIEDLDAARIRPGMAEKQEAELRSLGVDFDGEPVVQSERADAYAAALGRLGERTYAHVPLAVNPVGQRLAKRDGAVTMSALAELGVGAGEVLELITESLDLPPSSLPGLLLSFDPSVLPRESWVVASTIGTRSAGNGPK